MKVIDLLNKIANGEEVPKKVKVLDMSLLPEYQTITWNEDLKLYEYCDGCEFDRVLDKHHLEKYIKIIEDTPKEDNKIEKIKITSRFTRNQKVIIHKIDEIIDRLNGDDNE